MSWAISLIIRSIVARLSIIRVDVCSVRTSASARVPGFAFRLFVLGTLRLRALPLCLFCTLLRAVALERAMLVKKVDSAALEFA